MAVLRGSLVPACTQNGVEGRLRGVRGRLAPDGRHTVYGIPHTHGMVFSISPDITRVAQKLYTFPSSFSSPPDRPIPLSALHAGPFPLPLAP